MKPERTERMTEWDTRPFDGGYDGLRSLVDRGFSGAVTDGAAWAIIVNGRIVGVYGGDLSAFEDAEGTAYEAPDPSLALLFAMQEKSGEPRAQYYTEETPISTVDETLADGGFTGYIELSENVLSGDYYVVYSGGKSTGVAFVGNNETLYTGEEAFERADDEVGIYEVYDVGLDIVELPDPGTSAESADGSLPDDTPVADDRPRTASGEDRDEAPGDGQAADAPGDGQAADAPGDGQAADAPGDGQAANAPGDGQAGEASAPADAASTAESPSETQSADGAVSDPDIGPAETGGQPEGEADRDVDGVTEGKAAESTDTDSKSGIADAEAASTDAKTARSTADQLTADQPTADQSGGDDSDSVFSEEAAWRQAQTIPALDPEETTRLRDETGPKRRPSDRSGRRNAVERRSGQDTPQRGEVDQTRDTADRRPGGETESPSDSTPAGASDSPDALENRIAELEAALKEERNRKEALEQRREELAAERDRFRERASELESRVEELEGEIERLRGELSETSRAVPEADETMEPAEAISGTNLFVRYESKGKPTLDAVHAGEATREDLSANLKLEHHTSFEDEGLLVDGRAYREFLRDNVEYTFCQWIVEQLPFEIRETGNVDRLRDLYDAIPQIDRVEFDGTVAVSSTDADGQRENEAFEFDVVFRDRMGDPLFVANLNDSREPTTQNMVDSLVSASDTVVGKHDGLAAALSVTASYFEPGALDAVADATGGGLLSRSKRASYVKHSRKNGFHLCLVETREGGFHLNVPEL